MTKNVTSLLLLKFTQFQITHAAILTSQVQALHALVSVCHRMGFGQRFTRHFFLREVGSVNETITCVVLFPPKVFPVLWHLVCDDVFKLWEICPIFQKCNSLHVIIADPIEVLL